MWIRRFVLCAPEGDGSGAGGGGGQGGASGGSDAAGAATAADSGGATPAASGAAGAGAQPTAADKPSGGGSILSQGDQGSAASPSDWLPEKFRVTKEDGALDVEASSRKLAEAYGHAEKRLGSGDAPPAAATDYTVTVPDTLKETFDPKTDEGTKAFLAKAHEAGFTQKQIDVAMNSWFELAPQLVNGAAALTEQQAGEALRKVWTSEGEFKKGAVNAYRATAAAVERSGVSMDEVERSGLANNPTFIRLMASLGHEFAEDKRPGGMQMVSEQDVDTMMASEAYTNPKHIDHERVSKAVRAHFERKYGTEAAA